MDRQVLLFGGVLQGVRDLGVDPDIPRGGHDTGYLCADGGVLLDRHLLQGANEFWGVVIYVLKERNNNTVLTHTS